MVASSALTSTRRLAGSTVGAGAPPPCGVATPSSTHASVPIASGVTDAARRSSSSSTAARVASGANEGSNGTERGRGSVASSLLASVIFASYHGARPCRYVPAHARQWLAYRSGAAWLIDRVFGGRCLEAPRHERRRPRCSRPLGDRVGHRAHEPVLGATETRPARAPTILASEERSSSFGGSLVAQGKAADAIGKYERALQIYPAADTPPMRMAREPPEPLNGRPRGGRAQLADPTRRPLWLPVS